MKNPLFLFLLILFPLSLAGQEKITDPALTEVWEPEPEVVTPGPGSRPPSDALVLLGEKDDLSMWESEKGKKAGWTVENGVMTVKAGEGDIRTRRSFGDCQLHIEWRTPELVSGEGQGRGNSGVLLMGKYEVQVLDSYGNRTYSNGQAAAIYKQHIPLVNACLPPGEWQSYDIIWKAPVFTENGELDKPACVTVIQNGILVQNHVELKGSTAYIGYPRYQAHAPVLPLLLQDHGNPVSYRNIWLREL